VGDSKQICATNHSEDGISILEGTVNLYIHHDAWLVTAQNAHITILRLGEWKVFKKFASCN